MNFKNFIKISIILSFFVFIPAVTSAAVLYFEPAGGEYQFGDTFIVDLKIDTEGDCINTIEGYLSFSQDILRVADFSQANSFLTLWVEQPQLNQSEGLISFIGGIPGGYCGRILGDPGPSDLIGRVIFKVPGILVQEEEKNTAEIRFLDNSRVLLNDGLGTEAEVITQEAVFNILDKVEASKDEWAQVIESDKTPPEPFVIEVNQEPSIFEGRYFITFLTTDKQTGVDHYEIKEGKGDWQPGESPYLLEDQELQSIIKVKAVDRAGNETIAEYLPEMKLGSLIYWIVILTLIGLGIAILIICKLIKRK